MDVTEIIEKIDKLAELNLTEDGVHPDYWPDAQLEYTDQIIKQLIKHYEYEQD